MLLSTMISNGKQYANIPNTTFYPDTEALNDLNNAWQWMYNFIIERDDDYFATQLQFLQSSLTPVTGITFAFTYTPPVDFYKLRLLQWQTNNIYWQPVTKMTLENWNNSQWTPAYRLMNSSIYIYNPNSGATFNIIYYPRPLDLNTQLTSYDLKYPLNAIFDLMSYQVAIEISRKQMKMERIAALEARKAELLDSMETLLRQDDYKPEKVRNVFATGFSYWA